MAAEGVGAGEALEVAEEVAAEGEDGGRLGVEPGEGDCAAALFQVERQVAAGEGEGVGLRTRGEREHGVGL